MFNYSDCLLSHFHATQNVGELDPSHQQVGTGVVGSQSRGEMVRIQIQIDAHQVISQVRFKALGSGPTIAACSYGTQWLQGKTLNQAQSLTADRLVDDLELPQEKIHCAIRCVQAIELSIADYMNKN